MRLIKGNVVKPYMKINAKNDKICDDIQMTSFFFFFFFWFWFCFVLFFE